MKVLKGVLFLFFIYNSLLSLCLADINVSVNLNDIAGRADYSNQTHEKKEYFGVAPGGGNDTFTSYKYYHALNEMSPEVIRLEAITSDQRKIYDSNRNIWNYDVLDHEIEKMLHGGNRTIIANVFYTPRFLSSCPDSKFYAYCIPNDMNAWSSYVSNIAQHVYYKYGIEYWEIGNEPSGKLFFKSTMSDFFDFYITTAEAIKKVNNNILVGGFADNASYLKLYSDFFSVIKNHDPKLLDFVTFHWYGDWGRDKNSKYNPKDIFTISEKLKKSMVENGLSEKPIFLTEWNLAGNNPAPWGKDQVNSYFVASVYWLKKSYIDKSLFFRVEPYNNTNASLLDSNGNKNNVGDIFSILNALGSSNSLMQNGIYVFFSELRKEIVVSNYDLSYSEPKIVTLHFGGLWRGDCNHNKYEFTTYSNDHVDNNVGYVNCSNNDVYLDVIVNNFAVIRIKY